MLVKITKVLLFIPVLFLSNCSSDDEIVLSEGMDAEEEAMLIAVNEFRRNGSNCGSGFNQTADNLLWDFLLEEIARRHAEDMNENGFFAHEGSDGSSVSIRATELNYSYSLIGENIAKGFTNVDAVMEGWINSSSHCELLVNDNFTEIGVARVNDIWVMVLATPL
jgi:uncharacterized protein YkwD